MQLETELSSAAAGTSLMPFFSTSRTVREALLSRASARAARPVSPMVFIPMLRTWRVVFSFSASARVTAPGGGGGMKGGRGEEIEPVS